MGPKDKKSEGVQRVCPGTNDRDYWITSESKWVSKDQRYSTALLVVLLVEVEVSVLDDQYSTLFQSDWFEKLCQFRRQK